ncbi:response regulator [Geomonas sp. RF6]|uniref:response regulator transcription factor n=1 Tax=Geomonas sp. RF6 TaxID=2897342 RepID=UPI001E506172|nr:response regulator [Geomonas sp. RF6]UFS69635.1 response regulator [Geomonas sp. RF6]
MGNRLLLADDSITIQKVVGIIFANEELFELTVVDNGTAALEKAREIHPDVMLVDALMPGKSGYEVCAEVRRDPALAATPLLLLIGAFDPVDEEKTRECGADASITKPFESQQLIDRVKELLEVGRQRKEAPPAKPAPAAAAPAPAAPAPAGNEDIWGELAAETAIIPKAPAAPQAPAAAPQPPKAAPAPAAPVVEEIEEATLEDDLWGAFELVDEVEEEPAPAPPAAAAAPAAQPVAPAAEPSVSLEAAIQPEAEYEVEEFFTFEEDAEGIEETQPLEEEGGIEEVPAESFSFQEESYEEPAPFEVVEEAVPAKPAVEETFAQIAPEPVVAAAEREAAPPAQAPQAPAATGITEEQLVAALSKLSRDVIERIVWEVVPDLAEALIKEEIRKIKAGSKE